MSVGAYHLLEKPAVDLGTQLTAGVGLLGASIALTPQT
jgi:hypothetical protein